MVSVYNAGIVSKYKATVQLIDCASETV